MPAMSTVPRNIPTPFGPKKEAVWENLQILGISSYMTQTGNQPNDYDLQWKELVDISVPVGTLVIVPTTNFWFLAHGSLSPEFLDPLDDNSFSDWNASDHYWGLGWVEVVTNEVYEADFTVQPPQQSAQLKVVMHLCDHNLDDSWVGVAGYTLMFLGSPAAASPLRTTTTRTMGEVRPSPRQQERRVRIGVKSLR
jgi:hypothetical protein